MTKSKLGKIGIRLEWISEVMFHRKGIEELASTQSNSRFRKRGSQFKRKEINNATFCRRKEDDVRRTVDPHQII